MTETPDAGTPDVSPGSEAPAVDPWKGFRGVCAATLILEAIVIGLTFPVVATLTNHGITWVSGLYLGFVLLALVLLCGRQGDPRAMSFNIGIQVLVIAGGIFHWSIAVVGVIFACTWLYLLYVKRDVARRMALGQLPAQQADS